MAVRTPDLGDDDGQQLCVLLGVVSGAVGLAAGGEHGIAGMEGGLFPVVCDLQLPFQQIIELGVRAVGMLANGAARLNGQNGAQLQLFPHLRGLQQVVGVDHALPTPQVGLFRCAHLFFPADHKGIFLSQDG